MKKKMSEDDKKIKVSFSINEKLNDIIDDMVEKGEIKNKSQIVEKVLSDKLKS